MSPPTRKRDRTRHPIRRFLPTPASRRRRPVMGVGCTNATHLSWHRAERIAEDRRGGPPRGGRPTIFLLVWSPAAHCAPPLAAPARLPVNNRPPPAANRTV